MTTPTDTTPTTVVLQVAGLGSIDVTFAEQGSGRPFLLLHGGAGFQSVAGFAGLMAESNEVRVITPTHPGFGGTSRPELLTNPAGLASVYVELLNHLDFDDVVVVGNSVGGWI